RTAPLVGGRKPMPPPPKLPAAAGPAWPPLAGAWSLATASASAPPAFPMLLAVWEVKGSTPDPFRSARGFPPGGRPLAMLIADPRSNRVCSELGVGPEPGNRVDRESGWSDMPVAKAFELRVRASACPTDRRSSGARENTGPAPTPD